MAAVLPSLDIDRDAHVSRYFLPYQLAWIADDSPMRLAEKSVRIGWTYADAFKNVRKRLRHGRRDYLFATKDQPTAFEFVEQCQRFAEIFDFAKSIISRGVDDMRVPVFDREGKDTGFSEEVKVGYIKFDNGSRVLAFSSNPNALRAYGGDVGWDEAAFHPRAEEMWASASGRVTWGFDIGVWSSHNGDATLFLVFVREAQAGAGGWSYYRVTMEDAIEMGLVEKINAVNGGHQTREEFWAGCVQRARLPEVLEQEYRCNPRGGTAAIVDWAAIERCQRDGAIQRLHLEREQIRTLFGDYRPEEHTSRGQRIANYLAGHFGTTFASVAKHRVGFDVAASGEGDLACIYVDRKTAGGLDLSALFTCRTEDWNFLQTTLWTFLRRLSAVQAAGDETGLGRQICWETTKRFPGQFHAVNFASAKHDMGFRLMNQLATAEKRFPRSEPDVASDFYALRKTFQGGRWKFSEGSNALNPHSHCDIAWAGGLSSQADQVGAEPGPILPVRRAAVIARRERRLAGV